MGKIRVGVIPAAGHGRRLSSLPLTRVLPKCLLPILSKPILGYVIDNLKAIGVEEVYMVVGFKKELIQEYFEDGHDFGIKINYVFQPEPLGIAHAIGLTKEFISEPFSVVLGDDLTITESLKNLVNRFFAEHAVCVEGMVYEENVENLRQACCYSLDEKGKILSGEEKPSTPKTNIRGCGIYIFDPKVYGYIEKTPLSPPRNEREITNTIRILANEGLAYGGFIDGVNINVNTSKDLIEATKLLLNKVK
jgi:dTDP-glucose pyrophosphorylase